MNNHLADQGARLSALDGRPAFPHFGLPGFGGVPRLPASSSPVITEIAATTADSSASAPVAPSMPLSLPAPPHPQQPAAAPPGFGPMAPMPLPASAHMAPSQLYPPPPSEGESAMVPKYHKITVDTYDGRDDPLGWLNKCEQFFHGQLTREVDKVWMASYHLKGVAQQWYLVLETDIGRPTWPDFRQYYLQRFGPALNTNHLADLARLPFGANMDAYMEAFQARAVHAGDLTTLQCAKLFTGGLPDYIRVDVELHQPQNLQHAMYLARAFERHNAPQRPALPAPQRAARRPGAAPSTMLASALGTTADSTKEAPDYIVEEPEDLDDAPHLAEEAQFDPKKPMISLSAATGIRARDTMQLRIKIGTHELTTLLDSGSTHNFINPEAARSADLQFSDSAGAHVIVANGDRVDCQGLARGVQLRIDTEQFTVDCFSIPLALYDMVLGLTWLRSLGPIL
ncbi:uncharacterized protein [Miscanthus floridulus]|uniref:uncharacterized protein n=1 Tax=Miscanthus floridulus TaxID=154761 RepID=UPI0034588A98